jgi:hypothetical protein
MKRTMKKPRFSFSSAMRMILLSAVLPVLLVCGASAKINRDETGYVLLATNSGTGLLDNYYMEMGGGMSVSEPEAQTLITRPGTLKNLKAILTVPTGAGPTRTFTLRKNGQNTSLSITFTGATEVQGADTTDIIPVVPYDLIALQVTSTGTPPRSVGIASLELTY